MRINRYILNGERHIGRIAIVLCFILAKKAEAQVSGFGAQKTSFYNQAADNTAPTTPFGYSELAFVNTTNASDATSFTLSDNGSFTLTSSAGDPTSFLGNQPYATKSALDADFTAGDKYTFTAHGGSLDGKSGKVAIENDAYTPILYLTGTSFSAAKMVNPNASFTFSIASTSGSVADNLRSLSLYDPSGAQVYTADYSANTTTFTISKATIDSLQRGVIYTAALDNFNTVNEAATGFLSGAGNSTGFVTATNFPFEVVPEPSSTALLALGLGGLTIRMKRFYPLRCLVRKLQLASCLYVASLRPASNCTR